MATASKKVSQTALESLFVLKPGAELIKSTEDKVHVLGKGIICTTDQRAHKSSPLRIVVDATEGFIPLWDRGLVLRWRFNETSLAVFENAVELKNRIRSLLNDAITAWGDAAPIRFSENDDNSDFEIVVEQAESCTPQGCTLAQAFFPDAGRHQLYVFPTMFKQIMKEQVETLAHEIGHVFGLRHFFAIESEKTWPSEIFGKHRAFSIMNYGAKSRLTKQDRTDLKKLYAAAWSRRLTEINGTPIRLVRPNHYLNS